MPEPIENGYGCYCADCAGSWEQPDKAIRLCSCPCHVEDEDEHDEDAPGHDDTCDCDECCGDDVDHEEAPVSGCNCHDCIR